MVCPAKYFSETTRQKYYAVVYTVVGLSNMPGIIRQGKQVNTTLPDESSMRHARFARVCFPAELLIPHKGHIQIRPNLYAINFY